MGIPIPPEPEYEVGMPCARCDDKLWKPGKTPKFVYVVFAGLKKCFMAPPDPPNGVIFPLIQIHACTWHAYGVYPYFWEITWSLTAGASGLSLSGNIPDWGRYSFFSGWEPAECVTSFTNRLTCPWNGAEGGTGRVYFTPEPPPPVELLGLTPADDLFYEEFETAEPPKKLYKFCQRSLPMNILVTYQPPENGG